MSNNQQVVKKICPYYSWFARFTEDQTTKFPLNTFYALQTFHPYQAMTELIAGVLEYPLAAIQVPYSLITNQNYSMPCGCSPIQMALNNARYRNVNTDVI